MGRIMTSIIVPLLIVSLLANAYMGYLVSAMFGGGAREVTYQPGSEQARIAILPIEGMIDGSSVKFVREGLQSLNQNPPEALVLRVESGGGGVNASDRIWHQINQFKKQNPEVPVVASFGGVAASGGYYVAMTAEHIVAERTCMTGSIGVMAPVFTFEQLLQKVGVNERWIEAPDSPKKGVANNIFRSWDEEDVQVVKNMLGHMHQQFIDVVIEGRVTDRETDLTAERVRELAQGQTFNAAEAKANSLVDEVGYLDAAIAKAKSLAGIGQDIDPRITRLEPPMSLGAGLLLGRTQGPDLSLNAESLRSLWHEMRSPKLMYRAPLAK
jgi:protease-4